MLSTNMKKAIPFLSLLIFLALGCSNAPQTAKTDSKATELTSDAQIAGDVQTRISSDPDLSGRQISINVQRAAVTLSGTVGSSSEMMSALRDAQAADGVKQVVSALQIESQTPASVVSTPQVKSRTS